MGKTLTKAHQRKMQAGRRRKFSPAELRRVERAIDDTGKEHKRTKDIDRRVELLQELRRLGQERSRILAATGRRKSA